MQKYSTELTECKTNILKILETTEETSNRSINILNVQTELFNKMDNNLDTIHENLSISDNLVRNMMGFFTFFPKKIKKCITNVDTSKSEIKRNKSNVLIDDTFHEDPYYDEVYSYLQRLKVQALNQKEILSIHNVAINNITQQVDKSMENIKIIESNMKKI